VHVLSVKKVEDVLPQCLRQKERRWMVCRRLRNGHSSAGSRRTAARLKVGAFLALQNRLAKVSVHRPRQLSVRAAKVVPQAPLVRVRPDAVPQATQKVIF